MPRRHHRTVPALLTLAALLGGCERGRKFAASVSPDDRGGPAAPATAPEPGGITSSTDWVWWEAESPRITNFPVTNPWAPREPARAALLSGKHWLGARSPGKVLFLEYDIPVHAAGRYTFYVRKFWRHGPFRWRFDEGPWQRCGPDVVLLDDVGIAKDVAANWVRAGIAALAAGPHTVRIEVDADVERVGFDCFLLTEAPFVARGKLKPDQASPPPPPGWFAFAPAADPFAPTPLDLRGLNEAYAGAHGFIQARGDAFVHQQTGEPVRFWAINVGDNVLNDDHAAVEQLARRLAKFGVNMVRVQVPLWREDAVARLDDARLERIHWLEAALKRQGIYLALSSFWPYWLKPRQVPGFADYGADARAFALPFFDPRIQTLQRGWLRAALTTPNPYTGLPLAQDPALAFVEILNEDGLFFWTFAPYESLPAAQMAELERQFAVWLAARYGSIQKALTSWNGGGWKRLFAWFRPAVPGDDAGAGRVGLLPLAALLARKDARAQDTAAFLTDIQRRYFDGMYEYLKTELGFRGSVTGSNWMTADDRVLGSLDKWSNAGADFMDRHGYFSGPHEGDRAAYAISRGDRYADASALLFQSDRMDGDTEAPSFDLPIMDLAYNGKPSAISEIGWTSPNRARAEMPVLAAAYGALQGSDALVFFQARETGWPHMLGKFTTTDPVALGQFPATARMFRQGLVKTAGLAARVEARLSDLFQLKGVPVTAPQNLDDLRNRDVPAHTPVATAPAGALDPLAFLVGRVEVNVTSGGGASQAIALSGFIDRERKIVRSLSGELTWDYGRGVVAVDAPAAQGTAGFLSRAGIQAFRDVTIETPLAYGAVLVVALDEKPLASSREMLLQVMSEDTNSGWSAAGDGLRTILEVGVPPLVVKQLAGTVAFTRKDAATLKVTPLDANGYPTATTAPLDARHIALAPTTFYYLIEK